MSAGAPTAGQDFVTIEEAARRLGVRERTVYHWCARYREAIANAEAANGIDSVAYAEAMAAAARYVPNVQVGDRPIRIPREAFEAFVTGSAR